MKSRVIEAQSLDRVSRGTGAPRCLHTQVTRVNIDLDISSHTGLPEKTGRHVESIKVAEVACQSSDMSELEHF